MNSMQFLNKNNLQKIMAIAFALLLWQAIALLLNNTLLLAGPLEVLNRLFELLQTEEYWISLANSMSNILLGLFMAIATGLMLAAISSKLKFVDIMLWPIVACIKATPLASFVIICLVWVGNTKLSIITVFLIVFPIVYSNMLTAYKSIDKKLDQMLMIFEVPFSRRMRLLYIPQSIKTFISTLEVAIGMAFKSGVAAELIAVPRNTIGDLLREAKVFLLTADMFAWTFSIIVISVCVERFIVFVIKECYKCFINRRESFDKA